MSEGLVGHRWLIAAARFEGSIEAHRILKGGEGDDADLLLCKMFDEIRREADNG